MNERGETREEIPQKSTERLRVSTGREQPAGSQSAARTAPGWPTLAGAKPYQAKSTTSFLPAFWETGRTGRSEKGQNQSKLSKEGKNTLTDSVFGTRLKVLSHMLAL